MTFPIIFGFRYTYFEYFYLFLHIIITYAPLYANFGIAIPTIHNKIYKTQIQNF